MIPTANQAAADIPLGPDLRVAAVCAALPEGAGLEALIRALGEVLPDLPVRHALTRSGWHRLGGVIDISGARVAEHIADWAETESGGDVETLLDKLAGRQLFATRRNGQTHYLVANTGSGPADFVQIEVEEVQEVLDRYLSDPDWYPDTVAELVDPVDFPHTEPEPVGAPRLVFRRLVRAADLVSDPYASRGLRRFLEDWGRSSAGESDPFCDHWVFSVREFRDRVGDGRLAAKPVPTYTGEVPSIPADFGDRGAQLANLVHGLDRQVGYPFAWYFLMITGKRISHRLAEAVHADLMGAYAYLPARDLKVLRDWYADPYGV